jgi:chromosome segregation ATPase
MQAENDKKFRETIQKHKDEIDTRVKEHTKQMKDLNDTMEQLRKDKDAEIKSLNDKMEKMRTTLQIEIDKLTISVKDKDGENLNLKSQIIKLGAELDKFKDIEAQLEESNNRCARGEGGNAKRVGKRD